jgi:hypothetical protein
LHAGKDTGLTVVTRDHTTMNDAPEWLAYINIDTTYIHICVNAHVQFYIGMWLCTLLNTTHQTAVAIIEKKAKKLNYFQTKK